MEQALTLEQRVELIEREINFLKAQLPTNSRKDFPSLG